MTEQYKNGYILSSETTVGCEVLKQWGLSKAPRINLNTLLLKPVCVLAPLFPFTKNIEGHYSKELQANFSKFTAPHEDNSLP